MYLGSVFELINNLVLNVIIPPQLSYGFPKATQNDANTSWLVY